jgi:hypothetical protein
MILPLITLPLLLNTSQFSLYILYVIFQKISLNIPHKSLQRNLLIIQVILQFFLVRINRIQIHLYFLLIIIITKSIIKPLQNVFNSKFRNKFEILFTSFGLLVDLKFL